MAPEISARRAALLFAAPLFLLLLAAVVLPLARGTETLILRDVLNTHFPMKLAQAKAMSEGYFPLLDPYRAGGQPLAGNPNAVPFYPDNLLYLVGSPFWAFNAHFWLHLLLAPLAFYWLARAWGLRREAAWAAALCYTVSGFFLSHLNFYNLIAGAALAPALVAACLQYADPKRRALAAPIALLWTLLVLGGDPQLATLALIVAASALAAVWRERSGLPWRRSLGPLALLAAAFAVGSLVALPQLIELRRILPVSYRGYLGYGEASALITSWDPRTLAEWFLPFVYGRPDVIQHGAFWASRQLYAGFLPFYFSLYPGFLTFGLVAAAGKPRGKAAWWAWGSIGVGLFFALGKFNPVVVGLIRLAGKVSLRYPVKLWPLIAIGAALLCGLGFERLMNEGQDGPARRRLRAVLGVAAVAAVLFFGFLAFFPGPAEAWLDLFIPKPAQFIANERLRWAGLTLLTAAVLGALALSLRLTRRSWAVGGALLLAVHAGSQLFFLKPLYPTDAVAPYLVPPPALAHVPRDVLVASPDFNYLFGPSNLRHGKFPDGRFLWVERRAFYELHPITGPLWDRRFELRVAPEGLDTFLARMAQGTVKQADTPRRIRLLAAFGVGRLLLGRPLDPVPPGVRLLATVPSFGQTLFVYEIVPRAPEVFLARRVFETPRVGDAYQRLGDPGFDPTSDAVIYGQDKVRQRGGGSARVVSQGPESVTIEATAGKGGSVLVLQRSHLLYEATLDGNPVDLFAANGYRIGAEIPEGRHTLRLYLDRRPLHRSAAAAALGLLLVPLLGWWGRRAGRPRG